MKASTLLRTASLTPVVVTAYKTGAVTAVCRKPGCPTLYEGDDLRAAEERADGHLKDHQRAVAS